jgi:hypothetical protein
MYGIDSRYFALSGLAPSVHIFLARCARLLDFALSGLSLNSVCVQQPNERSYMSDIERVQHGER